MTEIIVPHAVDDARSLLDQVAADSFLRRRPDVAEHADESHHGASSFLRGDMELAIDARLRKANREDAQGAKNTKQIPHHMRIQCRKRTIENQKSNSSDQREKNSGVSRSPTERSAVHIFLENTHAKDLTSKTKFCTLSSVRRLVLYHISFAYQERLREQAL